MPEIAERCGIGTTQLYVWVKKYPEIAEAIKEREIANSRVADSLYKRATGYEYEEKEIIQEPADDKRGKQISYLKVKRTKKVLRRVPPDVTACIFWLKNRDPQRWRERPEYTANPEAMAKALEALVSAEVPPGAVPTLPRAEEVQDRTSRPSERKDGTREAEAGTGTEDSKAMDGREAVRSGTDARAGQADILE